MVECVLLGAVYYVHMGGVGSIKILSTIRVSLVVPQLGLPTEDSEGQDHITKLYVRVVSVTFSRGFMKYKTTFCKTNAVSLRYWRRVDLISI